MQFTPAKDDYPKPYRAVIIVELDNGRSVEFYVPTSKIELGSSVGEYGVNPAIRVDAFEMNGWIL